MKPAAEQLIAKRLLEAHEGGYTLMLFLRWSWKLQALKAVIFLFATAGAIVNRGDALMRSAFVGVAGIGLGAMLRDFGFSRAQVKVWPLNDRIIDWDRVRMIASGTEVGDPPRYS